MHVRDHRQILLAFVILLPLSSALGQKASSTSPPNRGTIAAVVQDLDAAWNARDAVRFSAVFSQDGSFGFPVEGIVLRGREQIRGYYDKLFAKMPSDLHHVTTIRDFEVINPDLVAVEVEVEILGSNPKTGATQIPLVHYGGMGLGVRTDSGWRIRLARVYQVAK
jgi:uncharacterized protein (TIGR02246 family)